MASSAPVSSLRRILEQRASDLSTELESLFIDSCDRARRELSDQLNQASRRMGQASDAGQVSLALLDATAQFAGGAAVFRMEGDAARAERIRGVSPGLEEEFHDLEIPLASAPALKTAVETHEPVVAAVTNGELSAGLAGLVGQSPEGRVSIFPVLVRNRAAAVLCAWGTVTGPALELLTQIAGSAWSVLPEPRPELVRIAGNTQAPGCAWEGLSPEEQRAHLRAQRFARVQVAEIRLAEPEAVQAGRGRSDLYEALKGRIDAAREKFRELFFASCPSMVDYLHLEIVRTLAHDDSELLGKDYPGPIV
jgi:hypothetical protein